jgi:hypothetical protein
VGAGVYTITGAQTSTGAGATTTGAGATITGAGGRTTGGATTTGTGNGHPNRKPKKKFGCADATAGKPEINPEAASSARRFMASSFLSNVL